MMVFEDAGISDGFAAEPALVEGGVVREVANGRASGSGERIGLPGRTLMPELIDLHVHVWISELGQRAVRQRTEHLAFYAAGTARRTLDRDFTASPPSTRRAA